MLTADQAIMDPLTILGTCAAISQLLSTIDTLIRTVRGSRKDLQAVASELESLRRAFHSLPHQANTYHGTPQILKNCNVVLKQIKKSMRKHTRRGVLGNLQWAIDGKDEMAALRSNLEAHKTSLLTCLGGINM